MRIGILGGSFDPIHTGHLQIAKTALKKMPVDEVWFMPSGSTPLKDREMTPFSNRCAMVKLAVQPYRKMKVCMLEGEKDGISYTIDTVLNLKKRYPQHTFCWLIGDDQAKQFAKWKDSEVLLQEVAFYVFSREAEVVLPATFQRVQMELIDVSSTEIRQGKKLSYVPYSVRKYMAEQALYVKEMIATYMNEHRYAHSLAVADVCVTLAKAHKLDVVRAYKMGLLHDVAKQLPSNSARIWMLHHMPEKLVEAEPIWHAYIGAYMTRHTFCCYDKVVQSAIYHHVKGDGTSPYDKILFISDKANPLRNYDCHSQLELAKKSINEAFKVLKNEQNTYLKEKGVNING